MAGAARHHAEVLGSDALAPGQPLVLRRDAANPHDANAIAVDPAGGGEQAGWVPRELAAEIAPDLDAGRPWSAVVLREQRASPRDPRSGLTMLLAPARGDRVARRVRLVTWNVAGRVTRHPEQAAAVAALARGRRRAAGGDGADAAPVARRAGGGGPRGVRGGARRPARADRPPLLGVLVAAREPLERLPSPADAPWPERVLCCRLGDAEIVNLHSPIAPAPELAKVRTHEAVAAYLAQRPAGPLILCGDLNTPRRELPDGDVLTFAHDSAGRLRPARGERWDRAERALVHDLREHGWVDAFRALHGYEGRHASWTFAQDRGGWRLDHVLARGLRPLASEYAHEWRRSGLSDHSALVVDLEPQPNAGGKLTRPRSAGS